MNADHPQTWREFALMVWRDRVRRRRFAYLVVTAGACVVVLGWIVVAGIAAVM